MARGARCEARPRRATVARDREVARRNAGAVKAGEEALAYIEAVKDTPIFVVETWLATPQTKAQMQIWQEKRDGKSQGEKPG